MTAHHSNLVPDNPDSGADEHVGMSSRRQLIGFTLAGLASLGIGATAVARHDDHKDDDDHSGGRDDHDDRDDDDHDRDDDHHMAATQMADGSWEVRITDDDADAFQPGTITIQPGESVTWTNDDDKPHTATGSDWDTGTIDPGTSSTITFTDAGTFAYSCRFHPEMTGTITVGQGNATPQASPAATPATSGSDIRMFNLAYEPATLKVKAGTTVTWTNDDNVPHTATSEDGEFDTNTIVAGDTAQVVFDSPGTYVYVCAFHPGMTGTIVVS